MTSNGGKRGTGAHLTLVSQTSLCLQCSELYLTLVGTQQIFVKQKSNEKQKNVPANLKQTAILPTPVIEGNRHFSAAGGGVCVWGNSCKGTSM